MKQMRKGCNAQAGMKILELNLEEFIFPQATKIFNNNQEQFLRDIKKLSLNQVLINHIYIYYLETRYFIQLSCKDDELFNKILALKSGFLYWLSFVDKIRRYAESNGLDKNSDLLFLESKYGNNSGEEVKFMNEITFFRKFANDIKHNQDYLSRIQISQVNGFYYNLDRKNEISSMCFSQYDLGVINSFYKDCQLKLTIAFNNFVIFINQQMSN